MKFENSAKRIEPKDWKGNYDPCLYGYDNPSPLFQSVISQSATYMLTGKFHDRQCGIYKCEGGCDIVVVDDLVLLDDRYYWNNRRDKKHLDQICKLITEVVLGWDPNNLL